MKKQPLIGFIGQGFIGKAYSDDFENRGYTVVRYAKEELYVGNKAQVKECDIVFIAVPTPTTHDGFDVSLVEEVIGLTGEGSTVVIKSTLLPGTTKRLAQKFSTRYIMHSPEFLRERTAHEDAKHPERTIIGIPYESDKYRVRADEVLAVLPKAPYTRVCDTTTAELIKYGGNCFLFTKVVFMNIMYDLAQELDADFDIVAEAMAADKRIGSSHMQPLYASGHVDETNVARGAGGHCFIKDMAAFSRLYQTLFQDEAGIALLQALEEKNNSLLTATNKDLDLLKGVYGSKE